MILPISVILDLLDIPDFRATLYPISICVISLFLLTLICSVKIFDLKQFSILDNSIFRFINTNFMYRIMVLIIN